MCGRFAIDIPDDDLIDAFDAVPSNDLPETPNFNVCPTNAIAVVTSDDGGRRLRPMRWGFIPHWYKKPNGGPLLINARSETIAEKPAFRAACRERRCLIPVTGFYEWFRDRDATPLPWFVRRADKAPLVMAGVWQCWRMGDEEYVTCAIVTTAANEAMARIHHRIPVILSPQDWPLWLGEAGKGAARLMKSAPEDALTFHRVCTDVNSNRATGAGLMAPIEGAGH